MLGTPVDLRRITVPTFVTGALTDHLTPWTGCYRTTQLLSGPSTFVLSYSGHIQSLVNPPGNPKASLLDRRRAGTGSRGLAGGGREAHRQLVGAWAPWQVERSGDEVPARAELGSAVHPPLEPAPGSYVVDWVPAA